MRDVNALCHEAYAVKTEFADWTVSRLGVSYLHTFLGSRMHADHETTKAVLRDTGMTYDEVIATTARSLSRSLYDSNTYALTEDVFSFLVSAAEKMEIQAFIEDDLPSESGFIWLPHVWWVPDIRGNRLPMIAIHWMVSSHGFGFELLADNNADGMSALFAKSGQHAARISIYDLQVAIFGSIPTWEHVDTLSDGTAVDPDLEERTVTTQKLVFKFLATLFAFIQQKVVTAESPSLRRHERRTVERRNDDPSRIRIVDLRRRSPRSEDVTASGHTVAWSHRWAVSGHWRQQPYRSTGEVRQIWINPYVKGDESLPLKVRPTVYRVKR